MEYVTLYNGVKMPILGYGVYQISKDECERCVLDALKIGYRHIDTAQSYFNEEEVGRALKKSNIPREEIFLTSKIWIEHYGYEECKKSVLESLRKLQTNYIDLMLLHQPFGDTYGAWKALVELYNEGKLKAIGVSNFGPDRLVEFACFNNFKPMINQIETNPFCQQTEARKWLDKYGIAHESWAPLGEGRNNIFANPTLIEIAKKYKKTVAQIMLKWNIQRNVIVIPKSTNASRMKENFNIFDFYLNKDDMKKIANLDTQNSLFFSHYNPEMVEWFAKMVEERKQNKDSSKEKKNW